MYYLPVRHKKDISFIIFNIFFTILQCGSNIPKCGNTEMSKVITQYISIELMEKTIQPNLLHTKMHFFHWLYAILVAVQNVTLTSTLKEEASHTTTHALSVVEDIKSIDQLVDRVAAFRYCAQIRHQRYVIALLKRSIQLLKHIQLCTVNLHKYILRINQISKAGKLV